MTSKAKCSRSYHQLAADKLDLFAEEIRQGMATNPTVFLTPPFTDAEYEAFIENYTTARATYKTGGSAQKPAFTAAKTALMGGMDTTADYVDELADGDVEIIQKSRFKPTKTSGSNKPAPVKPGGVKLERGETGELYAECAKVEGAESYGCILIANNPLPYNAGFNAVGQFVVQGDSTPVPPVPPSPVNPISVIFDMNKSRKKKFMGLAKGTTYYCYFYAVNATGVSPLSDGISLMCG